MSEKAPMQSTPFVSSTGETRNPIYEGQFDGEALEQAEARRHWAKVAMEMARNATLSAPSHGEQVRDVLPGLELAHDLLWPAGVPVKFIRIIERAMRDARAAAPSAGSHGGDV